MIKALVNCIQAFLLRIKRKTGNSRGTQRKETTMMTSPKVFELLQHLEGFKAEPYFDAAGVQTIGFGHTGTITYAPPITRVQALTLLKADLLIAEASIRTLISGPIEQNHIDALTLFVFNIGASQFEHSTLRQLHNAKRYSEASEQYTRWIYADGEPLRGLLIRRIVEAEIYRTGITNITQRWLAELQKKVTLDPLYWPVRASAPQPG